MSASPLLLDQADRVVLLRDGRVAATGTHSGLMAEDPDYRRTVVRGEEQD
jgi:ABC-type multidrug transport system fused ATPase/permease subunit